MKEDNKAMARYSEAHKKATLKYQQKAYDDLRFRMKKGFKDDVLKPAADAAGIAMNEFIRKAIIEKVQRDGPGDIPIDRYLEY